MAGFTSYLALFTGNPPLGVFGRSQDNFRKDITAELHHKLIFDLIFIIRFIRQVFYLVFNIVHIFKKWIQ